MYVYKGLGNTNHLCLTPQVTPITVTKNGKIHVLSYRINKNKCMSDDTTKSYPLICSLLDNLSDVKKQRHELCLTLLYVHKKKVMYQIVPQKRHQSLAMLSS
jgi:hypothetical protein